MISEDDPLDNDNLLDIATTSRGSGRWWMYCVGVGWSRRHGRSKGVLRCQEILSDNGKRTRAEIEIRRWLYKIGQWAPGAEQFGLRNQEETEPLGALSEDEIDQVLRFEMVGRIGCHADGKTYVVPIIYV